MNKIDLSEQDLKALGKALTADLGEVAVGPSVENTADGMGNHGAEVSWKSVVTKSTRGW